VPTGCRFRVRAKRAEVELNALTGGPMTSGRVLAHEHGTLRGGVPGHGFSLWGVSRFRWSIIGSARVADCADGRYRIEVAR
jgi:hypothetical protein